MKPPNPFEAHILILSYLFYRKITWIEISWKWLEPLVNDCRGRFKRYSAAQLICFDFVCWPKTLQDINQLHSTVFLQCCKSVTFYWGDLGGQPWLMKIHLFSLEYFIFPLFSRLEQPACNAGVRGQIRNVSLDIGINQLWRLEKFDGTDLTREVVITDKTCHWLFQSPEGFKVHRKYHTSLIFIGSHFSSLWPDLCQFTFYLLQQKTGGNLFSQYETIVADETDVSWLMTWV